MVLTLLGLLVAVDLVAVVTSPLLQRLLVKQHPNQLEHQDHPMHQAERLEHQLCLKLECLVAVALISPGQLLEQPVADPVVHPVVASALRLLVPLQQQQVVRPAVMLALRLQVWLLVRLQ